MVESQTDKDSYAVVETGGRQYVVRPQAVIEVNRLDLQVGEPFETEKVLLTHGVGGGPKVGDPYVSGAKVRGVILEHVRGNKILVFKKKRRKGYARTRGHRQELTRVKIESLEGA